MNALFIQSITGLAGASAIVSRPGVGSASHDLALLGSGHGVEDSRDAFSTHVGGTSRGGVLLVAEGE